MNYKQFLRNYSDEALLQLADHTLSLVQDYTELTCWLYENKAEDDSGGEAQAADQVSDCYITRYKKICKEQGRRGLPYTATQRELVEAQRRLGSRR